MENYISDKILHLRPFTRFRSPHFRLTFVGALSIGTALGIGLVLMSPFALRALGNVHGFNWAKLSNIGQTYGAISAILVALGLSGVAVTVFLQVQEARQSRVQAARDRHHELMRMALEDPVLMQALQPLPDFSDDEHKQVVFLNLIVQFWLMLWKFDDIDEIELRRQLAAELFSTPIGRRSWSQYQGARNDTEARRARGRRFYDILDEEYHSATAAYAKPAPSPTTRANESEPDSHRDRTRGDRASDELPQGSTEPPAPDA
jgi:hypothetical protein